MDGKIKMIVDRQNFSLNNNTLGVGKISAAIACAVMLGALTGCGSSSPNKPQVESPLVTEAPVALTPARTETGGRTPLIAPVNDAELRKAIERYRISKNRGDANTDLTGVDLNGDGNPEAVVLFAGDDWCLQTGCSLVVFQLEDTGYRPVSHITRARPPIMVGPDSNYGWNDLLVNTGGGPAPVRTVRLGFTGKGYPGNALLQPEPLVETISRSQAILAVSTGFTAYSRQASAASRSEGQSGSAQ